MLHEIRRIHNQIKATSVFVTHDQHEGMILADRIVIMNKGRIEQVGAPLDLYSDPANQFVAGFLGSPRMNFVAARVTSSSAGSCQVDVGGIGALTVQVRRQVEAGTSVVIGIRPEQLSGEHGAVTFPAKVRHAERLGRETIVFASVPNLDSIDPEGGAGTLTVQSPRNLAVRPDDQMTLAINPADILLFDPAGQRLDQPQTTTR